MNYHHSLRQKLTEARIIPMVRGGAVGDIERFAQMCSAHRITAIEVSVGPPNGVDAIRAIAQSQRIAIGAADLLTEAAASVAKQAGAEFATAPGATDMLLQACYDQSLALLPSAATPSEAQALLEKGYAFQRIQTPWGTPDGRTARHFTQMLPKIEFNLFGLFDPNQAREVLCTPNVVTVTTDWLAAPLSRQNPDWAVIENGIVALADVARGSSGRAHP